jgi:hypothetical protein
VAFTYLVNRISWHQHDNFGIRVLDHRLTAKPRSGCQAGRPIQHILFLFGSLRKFVEPLLYDYVTGRTGTIAAACMFQMNAVAKQNVKHRARK